MSIWFAYFAEVEMELGYSAQKHLFCTGVHHELFFLQLWVSRWKHPEKVSPSWVKDRLTQTSRWMVSRNRTHEEAAGALGDGLGLPLSAQPWLHSSSWRMCWRQAPSAPKVTVMPLGRVWVGTVSSLLSLGNTEHTTAEAREREQCLCAKSSRILTVFCNEPPVTFSLHNKPREPQTGSLGS